MNKRIFKYKIETKDRNIVRMPADSKILCVQLQNGEPHLWAMVDPSRSHIDRAIAVYGTGNPMDTASGEYIGTYQLHGGALVFHVFDETVTSPQ